MLNTLKATELKELGKEYKVSKWWTLKKEELIFALEPHESQIFPKEVNEEPETIIDPFGNELETETKVFSRNGIGVEIEMPIKEIDPNIELEDKQQEGEEPIMILSDFAYMFNFKTTKTRRILRDHNFDKNGGRWEWFKGDENVIEEIKEVLEKYAK